MLSRLLRLLPWNRDRETIRRRVAMWMPAERLRIRLTPSYEAMPKVGATPPFPPASCESWRARARVKTGLIGPLATATTDQPHSFILRAGSESNARLGEVWLSRIPTPWGWPSRPGSGSSASRTSQGQADGRSADGDRSLGYIDGAARRQGREG